MIRRLLILAMLMTAPASARGTPSDADRFIAFEQRVNHIPAIAYAVVRDGRVITEKAIGSGSPEWPVPVTIHSRFQLASVTKLYTGVLLMRMVEAGKLSLDAPISAYLADSPEAWRSITIRQLANHSSGIADGEEGAPGETREELFDRVARQPLAWQPGTRAAYGFNDFAVLALAMERAGGAPFVTLLARFVTEPLRLADTGYNDAAEQGPVRRARPLPRRVPVVDGADLYEFFYPAKAAAAGGLFSSIDDMARLMAALERPGFLTSASRAALTTAGRLNDGSAGPFGIGWIARTHQGVAVAGHSGGPALADVLYFPARNSAVIVLQNQHKLFPWLAGGLADRLFPPPAAKAVPGVDPALAARVIDALNLGSAGHSDPAAWSRSGQTDYLPWLLGDGRDFLRGLGRARLAIPVASRQDSADRVITYAIRFGQATMRWDAAVDASGKLESILPASS